MKRRFIILLFTVTILLGWVFISSADNKTDTKNRGKSVSASLIPDELKSVKIDNFFIKSSGLPVGTIQKSSGDIIVLHKDMNRAYFAATGDAVYQQDVFYTLKNSRCRIRFETEDVIIMGENGKISVDEASEDNASKEKKSTISMLRGKAMFYVMRLFKHKGILATVKTPTAVMGVRGTKFGVEVRKAGEKIADLSDGSLIYLAENDTGNFETIIHGFDGTVEVTSNADGVTNSVGAGESLVVDNLGAGSIEPTDPNISNQFIQQTEGGGFVPVQILGSVPVETGDVINNIIDTASSDSYVENISQTLTSAAIDESGGPVNKLGYFTALLTKADQFEMIKFHGGTYISTSIQNFDNPDATATDVVNRNGNMKVDASSGMANAKLTNLEVINEQDIISGNYPAVFTELGHNSYMAWGYWTQTQPMNGNYYSYSVDNRGYYIYGDPTSTNDMASLQNINGWWSYSGEAIGTYWTDAGGSNMAGSFTTKVNFMTNIIEDYNLSVTGGGHNASVTGAIGDLRTGSSHFQLFEGSAAIDGQQANFNATGSFYGPRAAGIGGVWNIDSVTGAGPSNHITGIYHGTNQGPVTAP